MSGQLFAFITAIGYASALICARRGFKYSTPTTVTLVSILMQNGLLWTAVFASGGVPAVPWQGVALFGVVGIFQLGVRLLAYTGVEKIGASRSSALQSVSPLISASLAIAFLKETTTVLIIAGTFLVVIGIVLVSWKPEEQLRNFKRRHLLLPLGAACLTGMNHPIRSYVLSLADQPLFFSALMGTFSLAGFLIYLAVSPRSQRLDWNRRAIVPFIGTGLFETVSILCIITALSIGQVVVIAPIAASYPVWALIEARIFLRDMEPVNWRIVVGILSVVAGNAAIHFGR